MKLEEIVKLVEGEVIAGHSRISEEVEHAFASDLMSDVLTIRIDDFILMTGLVNNQSIRTAEMSDVQYLLFVRGKKVTEEMLEIAEENDMVIITTKFSLFRAAGVLYNAGLKPVY